MAVLCALAADPTRWRYGYELGQEVGLKAGSLYPILMRLSDRELLESSWESDPSPGRPPRHLYRLTGEGIRYTAAAVEAQVTTEPRPGSEPRPESESRPKPRPEHVPRPASASASGSASAPPPARRGDLRGAW